MVRATSSLPTPLSPSSSTVALVGAARFTASSTVRSAGLWPTISYFDSIASLSSRFSLPQLRLLERVAQRDDHALAAERLLEEVEGAGPDGLARPSAVVPWPEIITTGSVSSSACSFRSTSMPSMPGHLDVEQDEVGALALHHGDAFLAAGGAR